MLLPICVACGIRRHREYASTACCWLSTAISGASNVAACTCTVSTEAVTLATDGQYSAVAGVTVVQPLSEARDKHSTYSSFFQPKPTEGFVRVPRGLGPAPAPFTATTTYE